MVNNNDVFKQNYRFFNDGEFKNDITRDNILPPDNIFAIFALDFFLARINTLLDGHRPNNSFSKKEILLKAKSWINNNIQYLRRECDRLFIRYYSENNATLKVTKHNKYKTVRNLVIF